MANEFITATELAGHLQQSLDTYTADQAIRGATAEIRAECGWDITPVVTAQTLTVEDERGVKSVFLPHLNVTVTTVVADGKTLAAADYTVNKAGGYVTLDAAATKVTVTYDAAYATAPLEVKDLCLELAADRYLNPERLVREQVGGVALTFATSSGSSLIDLLTDVRLKKYRLGPGLG